MIFLISSMAVTINLNTSLKQHSLPQSLSFYLYVMVLLGNEFCIVEQIHACIVFLTMSEIDAA